MRKLFVIGIGAGNPEHVTVQAIKALNQVDVFFVLDKGAEKSELVRIRQDICARYIEGHAYRFVEVKDTERDPAAPTYRAGVDVWHHQRADILQRAISQELGENQTGGFLVWGDPSLYDSTLRIIALMQENGIVAFEYDVIPGITSVQALAAAHRIALNYIGGPIHITTGRQLRENPPPDIDNLVVMLDGIGAFSTIDPTDITIHWGAYLGTDKQLLMSGPLAETAPEIERARDESRARHGWIMDTYLLRRRET
jgi:precorrin-6A synthase